MHFVTLVPWQWCGAQWFARHHRGLTIKVILKAVFDHLIPWNCALDRLFELWSFAGRFQKWFCNQRRCVLWIEFPVVVEKIIHPKVYGPLSFKSLLRSRKFGPVLWALFDCMQVQIPYNEYFHFFLHELAVEFPVVLIGPNFLLAHFVKIRHSDRRTELWSRAGKSYDAFELRHLDRYDQSFLIFLVELV